MKTDEWVNLQISKCADVNSRLCNVWKSKKTRRFGQGFSRSRNAFLQAATLPA